MMSFAESLFGHRAWSHPKPPEPCTTLSEAKTFGLAPNGPGVYFLWLDGLCVYVGISKDIQKRLVGHDKTTRYDEVSWLEMPWTREIKYAEAFYIGALRPARNFMSDKKFAAMRREMPIRPPVRRSKRLSYRGGLPTFLSSMRQHIREWEEATGEKFVSVEATREYELRRWQEQARSKGLPEPQMVCRDGINEIVFSIGGTPCMGTEQVVA